MIVLLTVCLLSAISQLATGTMTVGLVAMLVSVLIQIMLTEGQLSVIIMMSADGVIQVVAWTAVVYDYQGVVVVCRNDLVMATQAVADGDVDAANQVEDEVTRVNQGRHTAAAGDELVDILSQTTALQLFTDAADTRDIDDSGDDDGIHRQVAVVQAAGLPW